MTRVLSAAVLVALLVVTIWWLPAEGTIALAALAAAIAAAELAGLAGKTGIDVPGLFLAAAAALSTVAFAMSGLGDPPTLDAFVAVLLAAVVASGAMALATGEPGPAAFGRPAVMLLAVTYLGAPLGAAAWVRVVWGPAALTWLLAVIALSDSAQFYTGRLLGRRQLAPVVSPKKTVEGAVGGLVAAAIAGGVLARWALPGVEPAQGVVLASFLAAFGIVGDLFKSFLKRSASVKDSSHLIPGHGGVLDRIDSYLFAAPMFYLFLRFLA
jgi:phosphatidate cytidylyltransferase